MTDTAANLVDGQIVLVDPQRTQADITVIDDHDQAVIVRLSLDDLQRLRKFTNAIESCGDELAAMPQEDRIRFTPYGFAWVNHHFAA